MEAMPTGDDSSASSKPKTNTNRAAACAECRRLKLKCDRKVPCQTCTKRGCVSICPDGTLVKGSKGSRLVLGGPEELYHKIESLRARIRDLEKALCQLQSSVSTDTHPLLREDLLESPLVSNDDKMTLPGVFGTLTISASGRTDWYGTTASAEHLLPVKHETDAAAEQDSEPVLSGDILHLGLSFPLMNAHGSADQTRARIYSYLPSEREARAFVDIYYAHLPWVYAPLPRKAFMNDTFNHIYHHSSPQTGELDHHLALLFSVLALGVHLDLTRKIYPQLAEEYHALSRAALSLKSIFVAPTVVTIQTIQLLCFFCQGSRRPEAAAECWGLLGLGAKLAQSIGLHVDSGTWNLPPDEVQLRRRVFWEFTAFDTFQSLVFGRPPAMARVAYRVELPKYEEDCDTGNHTPALQSWKIGFTSQCMAKVMEQVCGVSKVNYATVLQLDAEIRTYSWPIPGQKDEEAMIRQLALPWQSVPCLRDVTLLYMHRPYCAQAACENPTNPLHHRFSPSVVATFMSAAALLASARSIINKNPDLALRRYHLWTHAGSAAITLATIAASTPGTNIGAYALSELDASYDIFETASASSFRVARTLPALRRLREKAHLAASSMRTGIPLICPRTEKEDMQGFSGHTRLQIVPRGLASDFVTCTYPFLRPAPTADSAEIHKSFSSAHQSLTQGLDQILQARRSVPTEQGPMTVQVPPGDPNPNPSAAAPRRSSETPVEFSERQSLYPPWSSGNGLEESLLSTLNPVTSTDASRQMNGVPPFPLVDDVETIWRHILGQGY